MLSSSDIPRSKILDRVRLEIEIVPESIEAATTKHIRHEKKKIVVGDATVGFPEREMNPSLK